MSMGWDILLMALVFGLLEEDMRGTMIRLFIICMRYAFMLPQVARLCA
jgi:hypothetical protein